MLLFYKNNGNNKIFPEFSIIDFNENSQSLSVLKPFIPLEIQQNSCRKDHHEKDSEWISEFPVQFGHKFEVHAVHACDECGWEEND